jgi:two-component system sensor histidine kinase KdpD
MNDHFIALGAVVIVTVLLWLTARAKRRADEAEANRREMEEVYTELQGAFERAAQAEGMRRSNNLKSALLNAVTDNMRTPLTSIKASVTALIGEPTRPMLPMGARLQMLQVMDRETDRLDRFIDKLVFMAQIDRGALSLSRVHSSVNVIMQGAVDRVRPLIGDREAEIAAHSDVPAIRVDARAIEEAIYQLLENAAAYSPPKTLIRVSASAPRGGMVEICVEDQGPGVSDDDRERIFEQFVRGASVQAPGLGLGLAIVKGLIEAHGGRVSVENRSHNAGARFTMRLPIGDGEAPA